ncbi:isochorismatase family protein [Leptolyngbya sp. FACHB-711]|uniref:isochorismatase family protein n=1 Tax=unclassified Leptolyngbya TaxID=2650499 RepID=UPI001682E3CC|nr:isochorismatase family protein [Leptolyngbya sp. FACHB-711]MBD1853272.1 isochorismatase family protein [Cyanobacteria bacterium FACHB-502]MBD2024520.1 isochorismatase family protein [Leptolyngbya sp. FACHB-711]
MKNKFTVENTAMLLIDHQQGTIKLARNLPREEIVQNTRALARVAVESGMSLVLTSSMEDHFQGLLLDDLQEIAPEAYSKRIKRPGVVDCWEYDEYKNAVIATGKKKLIMAGLTNDVCIVYPAISAIEDGFEVQVVVDAGGSPTTLADETALRRMEKHGVTLTSTNQVMAELANSWSEGVGQTIQTIMYQEILSKFLEA